jgi:hypothetical protein
MRVSLLIVALITLLAACGDDAAPTQAAPSPGAVSTNPPEASSDASPRPPSAEPGPSMPTSPAPPDAPALAAGAFARVVADALKVRVAPGLDAAPRLIGVADAPPLEATIGTTTLWDDVFILDGPASADGYTWFLVGTDDGAFGPDVVGWVAAGDGIDPWLVATERCPQPPLELADLVYTAATWAVRLGCAGGEELTLQGWYPELPPDIETSGPCSAEPAWLVCGYGQHDIRTTEQPFYSGAASANRLIFKVDPASGLVMPQRGQWIEVTGRFDHPAAASCGEAAEDDIVSGPLLLCRLEFVVEEARALDG